MNYQSSGESAVSDSQAVETGLEYEQYCKQILENLSWSVLETPASGDQGVDLIAIHPSGLRVCIQCKYASNPVGNGAVQEVVAGKAHYSGTHAVVVSHSGFTRSATDLARSNNVTLIGTDELQNLLEKII
jgi:HJR/Mrr/RecB family endonuclease